MLEGVVYVGRPTKWGNPFLVHNSKTLEGRATLVAQYRFAITDAHQRNPIDFSELRGKHLACWCPLDQPCHADALLELANAKP